ncbi:MAG: winged helix-turn-helix domain-containing protein [Acidobacteriota bacterium]|nr:winged helix-turn-helix domain-containing protein [Acidobacteriota bacterium]
MSDAKAQSGMVRFGMFELDTSSGELRKDGKARPRMRDQALQILLMLLEKPKELVTREEIRERVWPADTFVDFDHGVNTAINQVRSALGDSASNPTFIQTIPRRGYRFIAPVRWMASDVAVVEVDKSGKTFASQEISAQVSTEQQAKGRFSVLSDGDDLPAVGSAAVRILFSLIQVMYLVFYIVALARLPKADVILSELAQYSVMALGLLIVTAAVGIPVRLFLLSAAAFNYQGLSKKFRMMFPFVLMLDEIWALSPFLLMQQVGLGLALACAAILLYVPFAQRSLLLMARPARS